MDNPNPDPGEEYPHVSTQLFGTVDPEGNRYRSATSMSAPFNTPYRPPAIAPMQGFVADYINNFRRTQGRMPSYDEYSVIMQCYRATQRARDQHIGERIRRLRPLVLRGAEPDFHQPLVLSRGQLERRGDQ